MERCILKAQKEAKAEREKKVLGWIGSPEAQSETSKGDILVELTQRERAFANGVSLRNSINVALAILDDVKNEKVANACRHALIKDNRLSFGFWASYAAAIVKGEISEDIMARLEEILKAAVKVGSSEVVKAIISSSGKTGLQFNWAIKDDLVVVKAVSKGNIKMIEARMACRF